MIWSVLQAVATAGSALASAAAAYYWFNASAVKYTPANTAKFGAPKERVDMNPIGRPPGVYVGGAPAATTDAIEAYVKASSSLNAKGALCAFIAALCAVLQILATRMQS